MPPKLSSVFTFWHIFLIFALFASSIYLSIYFILSFSIVRSCSLPQSHISFRYDGFVLSLFLFTYERYFRLFVLSLFLWFCSGPKNVMVVKQTFDAIVCASKFFCHTYSAWNSWTCVRVYVFVCFLTGFTIDHLYIHAVCVILNFIQSNGHEDNFPFFCRMKWNQLNLVFHFFLFYFILFFVLCSLDGKGEQFEM